MNTVRLQIVCWVSKFVNNNETQAHFRLPSEISSEGIGKALSHLADIQDQDIYLLAYLNPIGMTLGLKQNFQGVEI